MGNLISSQIFSPTTKLNKNYCIISRLLEGFTKNSSSMSFLFLGPLLQVLSGVLLHMDPPFSLLHKSYSARHKWRITFTARLSAAITGVWALCLLLKSRSLRSDLMFTSSAQAKHLVLFSLGVHLAEAADMLLHTKPNMLLLHHLMVIICFSGSLHKKKAIGFAVLSLVTELNAVFNKTRILHIINGIDKGSLEYRMIAILNILTFTIRILIIGWMNNKCFSYVNILPHSFLVPCIIGLSIVNVWNFSVFRTLMKKDIFGKLRAGYL